MNRRHLKAGCIELLLIALLISVPAWAGDSSVGVVSRADYEFIKNGGHTGNSTPMDEGLQASVVSPRDEAFVRNGGMPGNETPLYGNVSVGKINQADYDFITRDGKVMPVFAKYHWWLSRK